jgi:MFS family permease
MLLSSVIYILYVLFSGFNFSFIILIFSVLLGFAASILWTAQGNYISNISSENKIGMNSGIFFGIFNLSIIFGNLIVGILFSFDMPLWITFLILFGIGFIGIVLLLFIKPVKPKKKENLKVFQSIFLSIKILFNAKLILLLGFCFYSGFSMSIFSGKIPEIIGIKLGKDYVGYAMSFFGLAEFFGSFLFGKLIEKFGSKFMIVVSFCLQMFALFFTFFLSRNILILYFISSALNGFADSCLNPTLYAIIGGKMFQSEGVSNAFASFRLVQSLSYAIGYFASIYLQIFYLQMIAIVLLLVSFLMFVILDLMIQKIE